jgi:hypothetical protein
LECDSELIRIESKAFSSCSLESVTILRHLQFIDGSAFATISKISISITSDNLLSNHIVFWVHRRRH